MQKASTAPSHGGAFDVSFFADVFRDARHYGVRDDLVEGGLTRSAGTLTIFRINGPRILPVPPRFDGVRRFKSAHKATTQQLALACHMDERWLGSIVLNWGDSRPSSSKAS
jgi:hypothetical protein